MVWRNRVAMLSGRWVVVLPLHSCQSIKGWHSRGAPDRVWHLKKAIPCYRVSSCGRLRERPSRVLDLQDLLNQYFSIHVSCVRNASFDINRQIAEHLCGPFQCGTHRLRINYHTETCNQSANYFQIYLQVLVFCFWPKNSGCLDCHGIHLGLNGAALEPLRSKEEQ